MAKITKREVKREVRMGLDPTDREPLVKDMLRHKKKIDSLTLQAKDTQAGFRKDIKEEKDKLDEVCATLERGKPELRDVIEIKNFGTMKVKYQDVETKRIVEERDMNEDDGQVNIGETASEPVEKAEEEA